jgi:predicted TIM-barrel fold metal-dependent hydrolase
MSRVVDFRARPNVPELAAYLEPRLAQIEHQTYGTFGAYRAPIDTAEAFLDRLDEAGVDRCVVAARSRARSDDWKYTRQVVIDVLEQAPERLIGLVGLDVSDVGRACEEARVALTREGFIGVSFDAFQLGTDAGDPRLFAIYELCTELGALVTITLGGLPGVPAEVRCSSPLAIDAVAQRFPDLTIVASHAGWPFVQEMIVTAWRNRNVYFENSFYHHAPGTQALVEAANTMIPGKVLYASAYPFAPLKETLERFRTLPFEPDVLEAILCENPARVIATARENLAARA